VAEVTVLPVYDPHAPLPGPGIHLLEASAGTGKTHTITDLVLRYVASGQARLPQILVMTFSRAAAGELRDRIRTGLASARLTATDPTAQQRLAVAAGEFEDASISTIHQFCIDAYGRLGIRADRDPREEIAEDHADLIADLAGDLYLKHFLDGVPPGDSHPGKTTSPFTPTAAQTMAKALAANPDAELATDVPLAKGTGPPMRPERERIEYAQAVREHLPPRLRSIRSVTFDDVVLRLRDALADPAAVAALRRRFRVVLIDEFQDTDPAQWQVVERGFLAPAEEAGSATVLLIGDPKQGIYAFRGADIFSYSRARARAIDAGTATTMGTNHRSDRAVVDGIVELFDGASLGDGISVLPVAARHPGPRAVGPGMAHPEQRVRLRWLEGKQPSAAKQDRIAADVADEILRTLTGDVRVPSSDGPRPPTPRDFAVIVRTNRQAEVVRRQLQRQGLPAIINSRMSVYATPAATDWAALLRAMQRSSGAELRAAALTRFFGAGPADIADDAQAALDLVVGRLGKLVDVFHRQGVPGVFAALLAAGPGVDGQRMYPRVLSELDGERYLTDSRHVAGLLHAEHRRSRSGLAHLEAWLGTRVGGAEEDDDERDETLIRRLDSDADAVQVVTVHSCKGLQYGFTYVPYGWTNAQPARSPYVLSDPDLDHRRVIDVGSYDYRVKSYESPTARRKRLQKQQADEEARRMLYVAATRGIYEVTVYVAEGRASALETVLGGRGPGWAWADVAVEQVPEVPAGLRWDARAAGRGVVELAAAPYDRSVDATFARPSFTALTRDAHGAADRVEFDVAQAAGKLDDEVGATLFEGLPAGAAFGTLVHEVLEHVDTGAADLDAAVLAACEGALVRTPLGSVTAQALAPGLAAAMRTPLGPVLPGTTLADIAPGDRLAELAFDLPVPAGATVAGIGAVLAGQGDPWVAAYGQVLRASSFGWKQVRGFLTGSIDAVLRVDGRYVVVDYKSNLLGSYGPDRLPAAMADRHYPLQALLYAVALHRYLRWRLPGYDPATHLGGILYLFVRGMVGPGTPTVDGTAAGVFAWTPDAALVEELDALLGGGR
jgi:exodeoxyribonuclease V beta subunit